MEERSRRFSPEQSAPRHRAGRSRLGCKNPKRNEFAYRVTGTSRLLPTGSSVPSVTKLV